MSDENRADASALPPTPCSVLEAVRGMVRDRQYEIRLQCDELPPKKCPIEKAAWDRVHEELSEVAELCNRMIYRISSAEGQRASCPEAGDDKDALACSPSAGDSSPNSQDHPPEGSR